MMSRILESRKSSLWHGIASPKTDFDTVEYNILSECYELEVPGKDIKGSELLDKF
jgi:hypothetical protein